MSLFEIKEALGGQVPIVLSIPHSGTDFPQEVKDKIDSKFIDRPNDTDWFVDRLYDFAPQLGITTIKANYSRYVIDLNRNSKGASLYNDGRKETGLVPVKSFDLENLYSEATPHREEIDRRIQNYYWPYYDKVQSLLDNLQTQFEHVLLFDAHSIKRQVLSISSSPFPDLILGNQDGKTASPKLVNSVLNSLKSHDYHLEHNHLFKGGNITRYFGSPEDNRHALQLEMVQEIYMDESHQKWDQSKASKISQMLKEMFVELIAELKALN